MRPTTLSTSNISLGESPKSTSYTADSTGGKL